MQVHDVTVVYTSSLRHLFEFALKLAIPQENGAGDGKIYSTKHPEEIAKSCKVGFESIFVRPNSRVNNIINQIQFKVRW